MDQLSLLTRVIIRHKKHGPESLRLECMLKSVCSQYGEPADEVHKSDPLNDQIKCLFLAIISR